MTFEIPPRRAWRGGALRVAHAALLRLDGCSVQGAGGGAPPKSFRSFRFLFLPTWPNVTPFRRKDCTSAEARVEGIVGDSVGVFELISRHGPGQSLYHVPPELLHAGALHVAHAQLLRLAECSVQGAGFRVEG